jgi:hypothetical protein
MFKTFQQIVRVFKNLDKLPILQEVLDSPVFVVINMDSLERVHLIRRDCNRAREFQVLVHRFVVFRFRVCFVALPFIEDLIHNFFLNS